MPIARGAYVELNCFHAEMFAPFQQMATHADLELDFFLLRENLDRSDPFEGLGVDVDVRPIHVSDPANPCDGPIRFGDGVDLRSYDFVIVGTAEPADRIAFGLGLGAPVLLIVHNPPDADLPDLAGATWAVTNPAAARRHPEAVGIHPVHARGIADAPIRDDPSFAVAGNLQFGRRNYGSLLRALSSLRDRGVSVEELEIRIIGRSSDRQVPPFMRIGLDGDRFLAVARRAGVEPYLRLDDARDLTHAEFRRAVGACRYTLPLLDDFYLPTRRFMTGKGSAALWSAISALTIPVVNQRLAESQDLVACHTYRLDDVGAGIERALAGDDDHLVHELARHRDDQLAASAAALRTWVESL